MLAHTSRILVVEDEEHARKIYQRRLENLGYDCTIASNPADASDLMDREDFDLMILDIMMPGKSGMDFLPEVVAQRPAMAVVMLTALADIPTAVAALQIGAADYITKPVDLGELASKVENALERHAVATRIRQRGEELEGLVDQTTEQIEQRTRELAALNKLFQKYLTQDTEAQGAYKPFGTVDDVMNGWSREGLEE